MVRAILHVEPMEMKIETFTGRIHSADRFSDGCTELFANSFFLLFFFFFFFERSRSHILKDIENPVNPVNKKLNQRNNIY